MKDSPSRANGANFDAPAHQEGILGAWSGGDVRRCGWGRVGSDAVPGYPRPLRVRPCPLRELADITSAPEPAGNNGTQPANGADGTEVTGVTHASSEVRPGDLYAALPGARRHGAEFAAGAGRGRRGRRADRPGRRAPPQPAAARAARCWSSPTRGRCSARSPPPVYGDPTAAAAGHRHHRHGRQDLDRVPDRVRAARGRPHHLPDRHRRDPARRRPRDRQRAHHARGDRPARAVRRGAGAGRRPRRSWRCPATRWPRPGRRGALRRRRLHQLRPGPPRLPRRRRGLLRGQGAAVRRARARPRCSTSTTPALAPAASSRRTVTYSAAGDPARDLARRRTSRRRRVTASASPRIGPDGVSQTAGVAPARAAQRGQRAARARRAWSRSGVDAGVAAARRGRLPRRARPAGAGRRARRRCSAWSTTRTSRTRSSRRWPRCAAAARRGGRLICVHRRRRRPGPGQAAADGRGGGPRRRLVVVTDDNPRTEDPAAIRAEVLRRRARPAGAPAAVIEVAGRRDAIAEAVRLAEPGDVVALLGKGHETRPGGRRRRCTPFDDRVELAAALTQRGSRRERRHDPDDAGRDRRGGRRHAGRGRPARPLVTGGGRVRLPQGRAGRAVRRLRREKVDGHDFAAAGGGRRRGRRCSARRPTPARADGGGRRPAGRDGPAGPGRGRPAARA